jgi:hypothetical protein
MRCKPIVALKEEDGLATRPDRYHPLARASRTTPAIPGGSGDPNQPSQAGNVVWCFSGLRTVPVERKNPGLLLEWP